MPIYKVDGVKQDGLQKYKVRVNFLDALGNKKQLTRVVFGLENAKEFEKKLSQDVKNKQIFSKLTLQELYDEYIRTRTQKCFNKMEI